MIAKSNSSSIVLGFSLAILLLCGVIFSGYFTYLASEQKISTEAVVSLEAEYKYVTQFLTQNPITSPVSPTNFKLNRSPEFFKYRIQDGTGTILYDDFGGTNLKLSAMDLRGASYAQDENGQNVVAIQKIFNRHNFKITIARINNELLAVENFAKWFGLPLSFMFLVFSAISAGVGFYVIDRIRRISEGAARVIREGTYDHFLPTDSSWDDLSRLTRVINQLLSSVGKNIRDTRAVTNSIAHELRTPLTNLLNYIEVQGPNLKSEEIAARVQSMIVLTRALLRVSEVAASERYSMFEEINIRDLLDDLHDLYEPLAEERGLALYYEVSDVKFIGDRDLIFQLLCNLLDNAVKYSQGGERVCLSASRTSKSTLTLAVSDAGPGIPEDLIDKLGKPFVRHESVLSIPGHGLGIPFVFAVVELHGGRVEFGKGLLNSESGYGLKLTVHLPDGTAILGNSS